MLQVNNYSGFGSHDSAVVEPYLNALEMFFKNLDPKPVVVDLGCGDFYIGSQVSRWAELYHACDIVADLIETLVDDYQLANVKFHCLDATREKLPAGDVLIVRQVLQHLSNDDIAKILNQFHQYRYILLTEHLPLGDFTANKEKPNGPDTRLRWQSGVDLLQPPFNLQVKAVHLLFQSEEPTWPSTTIKTMLYEM